MPINSHTLLPDALRHLQPFVNSLAKLPQEHLNEDVDASRLESVLRKRLRGLDAEAAEARLAEDREFLERWLKTQPDHPAHWVLGFLLAPNLGTELTHPAQPPPRGPRMMFEAPNGWRVKLMPFRLDLSCGKMRGSITVIDELTYGQLQREREQTATIRPPGCPETTEVSNVTFGPCRGRKYLYEMMLPARWKQVEYVLSVPGGYVDISLGTRTGAEFDEMPLEAKLHTLQLSASA